MLAAMGLDPAIRHFRQEMDHRVSAQRRPGDDAEVVYRIPDDTLLRLPTGVPLNPDNSREGGNLASIMRKDGHRVTPN